MAEITTATRVKRAEQDIETLRTTQSAMLNHFDRLHKTMKETRDIADENRSRLERVETRLQLIEEVVLENRDMIRENRKILLNIADHLDLTLETPDSDQPD